MIDLDAASVLLQWATGGLFFLWVTGRRREVGIGYGWTMRITFGLMAAGAVVVGFVVDAEPVREAAGMGVVVATTAAMVVSVVRRRAGVAGQRGTEERRTARVAAMTGIDREDRTFDGGPEFPPHLDLVAPIIGLVGLVAAGLAAGNPAALSVGRMLVGAVFLGAVSDAMLLGHWYLVQPGLARAPILEQVRWAQILWVPETIVFVIPTGMWSVLNGDIDDAYNGLLGWFWVASVLGTGALILVCRLALKERQYSAVMAATGLMYLAILTGFGQDIVARVLLSP